MSVKSDGLTTNYKTTVGVESISLKNYPFDPKAFNLFSPVFARNHLSLPLQFQNGRLLVAMGDPADSNALKALKFYTRCKIKPLRASKEEILIAIDLLSGKTKTMLSREKKIEPAKKEMDSPEEAPLPSNRFISLISNKGGVGKTHCSINLSCWLAQKGKNILLVDADMGNADISNKVGIFPPYSLISILNKEKSIQEIIHKTNYGFDFIGGNSGEFKLANINYAQKLKFMREFEKLRPRYDLIVFDLGAGISRLVLDFALYTDQVMVLTTPLDVVSGYACLKALFFRYKEEKFKKTLKWKNRPKTFKVFMIINQLNNLKQGQVIFNKLNHIIDENINSYENDYRIFPKYLGGLSFDRDSIRKAEQMRQPVINLLPRATVSNCLKNLGGNLLNLDKKSTKKTGYEPREMGTPQGTFKKIIRFLKN